MTGSEDRQLWDYNSPADMLAMARDAIAQWRDSPPRRAAERKAAQRLVFAVGRLDSLGALDCINEKVAT